MVLCDFNCTAETGNLSSEIPEPYQVNHWLALNLTWKRYCLAQLMSYLLLQLLLKSLNTPADLLCQLRRSISLILRMYACSTSTILIASVQRPRIFNNERITNQKKLLDQFIKTCKYISHLYSNFWAVTAHIFFVKMFRSKQPRFTHVIGWNVIVLHALN